MTERPTVAGRILIVCTILIVAWIAVSSCIRARDTLGRPFPGLFVDPYGSFSVISLPAWRADELPLRFPDRLTAIEGRALLDDDRFNAEQLSEAVRARHTSGATEVTLSFERVPGGALLDVRRPVRTIGIEEFSLFYAGYALSGLFLFWSGVVVLVLSNRNRAGMAYFSWATSSCLFFLTFYDYHTTVGLVALFSLATVGVQASFFWLAYAFPEPPRPATRRLARPALGVALSVLGLGAASNLLATLGLIDGGGVRAALTGTVPLSFTALVVSVLTRLRTATGPRRRELLPAVTGLVAAPVFLAVTFVFALHHGVGLFHFLLPLLAALIPMGIGYGLIRNNILAADTVLSKRLLVVPLGSTALAGGAATWAITRTAMERELKEWLPIALGGMVFVILLWGGARATQEWLFPARAKFRRAVERLSEHLGPLRDLDSIRTAIERVILEWIPTRSARVLSSAELSGHPKAPHDAVARLSAGHRVWTEDHPWDRHLMIAMRSMNELHGVLVVAPKYQSALYTAEDLTLLDTVATLGAVALHNASVLLEVERLRELELGAARDEKRVTIGLLAAEMSHEIAYPLGFFRHLLERSKSGNMERQDIDIGREEVERLDRMLATLRKLRDPAPVLVHVRVIEPIRRALDLIRDLVLEKQIHVALEIDADLMVLADPDHCVQVFANLLRNAAQAVGHSGSIGVRSETTSDELVVEVWDSGAGIPPAIRESLFNPWMTTKSDGTGLGLAVAQRLVSGFGWTIGVTRRDERTCFRLSSRLPVGENLR